MVLDTVCLISKIIKIHLSDNKEGDIDLFRELYETISMKCTDIESILNRQLIMNKI